MAEPTKENTVESRLAAVEQAIVEIRTISGLAKRAYERTEELEAQVLELTEQKDKIAELEAKVADLTGQIKTMTKLAKHPTGKPGEQGTVGFTPQMPKGFIPSYVRDRPGLKWEKPPAEAAEAA